MIIKILLVIIGLIYFMATITFCTMCMNHFYDWDLFQTKDEIIQFGEGNYIDEVTYHWFEIELVAIPSKIGYYLVAYYFFLKHR